MGAMATPDDAAPDPVGDRSDEAPDGRSDDERLAAYAGALADGVEAALAGWVEGQVERIMLAWSGGVPDDVRAEARRAGRAAHDELGPRVRALLALDIDEQRSNPMTIVRTATAYPTAVLRSVGVPPVERDASAEAQFPDDDYDLVPTRFADLDPGLHEPGLLWGAAKAHVHLARRRAEGRR
jgi:hypothetical protein